MTNDLISKALDTAMLNHKIIANNVANVNTQGYRAMKLDFDHLMSNIKDVVQSNESSETLKTAIQETNIYEGVVQSDTDLRVALDEQMAELAKNSLRYQALISARGQLSSLMGTAIRGEVR